MHALCVCGYACDMDQYPVANRISPLIFAEMQRKSKLPSFRIDSEFGLIGSQRVQAAGCLLVRRNNYDELTTRVYAIRVYANTDTDATVNWKTSASEIASNWTKVNQSTSFERKSDESRNSWVNNWINILWIIYDSMNVSTSTGWELRVWLRNSVAHSVRCCLRSWPMLCSDASMEQNETCRTKACARHVFFHSVLDRLQLPTSLH